MFKCVTFLSYFHISYRWLNECYLTCTAATHSQSIIGNALLHLRNCEPEPNSITINVKCMFKLFTSIVFYFPVRITSRCWRYMHVLTAIFLANNKLMKGKASGSIACTRKQQPRFYWSCSSVVMNYATPLTPPSAWAELHFQM